MIIVKIAANLMKKVVLAKMLAILANFIYPPNLPITLAH